MAQKEKEVNSNCINSKVRVQHVNGITTIHLGSDSFQNSTQVESNFIPLELQLHSSSAKWESSSKPITSMGYINKAFVNHASTDGKTDLAFMTKQQLNQSDINKQQVAKLGNQYSDMKNDHRHKFASIAANPCNDLTFNELDEFLSHINPIDTTNWRQTNLIGRLISILRAPLLLAAILTIPVLDSDRRQNNWCRLLNSLHCLTAPLAFTLATHFGSKENLNIIGVPLPVILLVPGLILGAFVLKTTDAQQPPNYHSVFAYAGFLMSILWIYLLATEIISLLKTVGIMFSMSDTAIGLGVLAWGNSLGDIVANISLAEAGYPRMAIGASIGAPLLNLLLGFGLSFTINLKPGQSTAFDYTPTITLLCSTLAIILFSLMLSTLAPPERSKKPFGYLLISCYGIYFALAVCLEYGIIKV